jgi:hypothetical protein
MYTLPLGYVLPLNGRTRDLHPVDVRHAWRTKKEVAGEYHSPATLEVVKRVGLVLIAGLPAY